jgi:hypothetical protein
MARALVAGVVAGGVLLWAGSVRAQVLTDEEAARNESIDVRLKVVDAKDVKLELFDPNELPPRSRPAAVCFDRCALNAVPGRYLLQLSGPRGSDVKTSKRFLDLEESTDVIVDPPSAFQRYFGLTLGILGPTLVLGGLAVMVMSSAGGGRGPNYAIGGYTALTGLVMTPVGWVMFAVNGKPSVEMRPHRWSQDFDDPPRE